MSSEKTLIIRIPVNVCAESYIGTAITRLRSAILNKPSGAVVISAILNVRGAVLCAARTVLCDFGELLSKLFNPKRLLQSGVSGDRRTPKTLHHRFY